MAGVAAVVKPSEFTLSYRTNGKRNNKFKNFTEGSLQLIPGLGEGLLDRRS